MKINLPDSQIENLQAYLEKAYFSCDSEEVKKDILLLMKEIRYQTGVGLGDYMPLSKTHQIERPK